MGAKCDVSFVQFFTYGEPLHGSKITCYAVSQKNGSYLGRQHALDKHCGLEKTTSSQQFKCSPLMAVVK